MGLGELTYIWIVNVMHVDFGTVTQNQWMQPAQKAVIFRIYVTLLTQIVSAFSNIIQHVLNSTSNMWSTVGGTTMT